MKERGLPAWINSADGRNITVTLFSSEPVSLQGLFKDEGVDPALWAAAKEHRYIHVVVADENLRTAIGRLWSKKGGTVRDFQTVPTDCYGCSGVRWVIEVDQLLEGFRAGRIVRLFVHPSWPINDMPFGEGLHQGGHDIDEPPEAREVVAIDFPLSYRLWQSAAAVVQDPTCEISRQIIPNMWSWPIWCTSTMISVRPHSNPSIMARRCSWCSRRLVSCSSMVMKPTCRIFHPEPAADCRCMPMLKVHSHEPASFPTTSRGFTTIPPPTGSRSRVSMRVVSSWRIRFNRCRSIIISRAAVIARFWPGRAPRRWSDQGLEGDRQITLAELAIGDVLLVDIGASGHCSDVWVGVDTHKMVREQQRTKHRAAVKERGVAAFIDNIDGKRLSISFFAGIRKDFPGCCLGNHEGKMSLSSPWMTICAPPVRRKPWHSPIAFLKATTPM